MKQLKIFSIITLCALYAMVFLQCKKADESAGSGLNNFKRYPFKNAHLSYEYSGDARGTEEIYIADYGKYEAVYSKFDLFSDEGIRPFEHTGITRLADIYQFDNLRKTGAHIFAPGLDSLYHLAPSVTPTPEQYAALDMKNNYFKNIGMEMIQGKPAMKWQQADGNIVLWIWHSILLKKYAATETGRVDVAIKNIDTMWVVDTTKFSLPTDIIIK